MQQKITLQVTGMSCEHCVRAVTEAIRSQPDVSDITVSLELGVASFVYNPDTTSLDAIKDAIREEDFGVLD